MKTKSILLSGLLILALGSCRSYKEIPYFQDADGGANNVVAAEKKIRMMPDDKLSIIVYSKDTKLANLLNLPLSAKTIGAEAGVHTSYNQGISAYTVDSEGNIDFPVLGRIHIQGLTREEIAELIKSRLVNESVVRDPVVTVEYVNLMVSVMGEVTRPGRFNVTSDTYTILDAISAAGDLTIFGLRENVKVLRYEGDSARTYEVNLCSTSNLVSSPVYYLQQNDVIYVEPNKMRTRQSTVNGNTLLSTQFWISLANVVMTFFLYFVVSNK